MLKGSLLAALFAVMPVMSLAEVSVADVSVANVSVPDTPAGQALGAWLDAFNSANRANRESFITTHAPWMKPDDTEKWRAETGGYDLLEVHSGDKTLVVFRMKARTTAGEEVGRLRVSDTEPATVTGFRTWRVPTGAKLNAVTLDATARDRLVERVAEVFNSSYVYPEVGQKISAALRKHEAHGDYRKMLYGEDLAGRLTDDLREVSHDKHAEVRFSYFVQPAGPPTNTPANDSRRLAASNCGFEKAEHLRPNIGYVKFNMFADPEICASTASAAMTFLADSDAVVIDLRDNNGGMGGMVEFVASYLFAERTHLNDIYWRPQNSTKESWTLPSVPGKKLVGKPIYVLTSNRTFSAGEDLCYALKNLHRATLIGETTGGGAHPINIERIDDQFSVIVPVGRSISPITKADWEGTGVEPDVKVAADQALDVALKLAAEEINKDRANGVSGS